MRIFDVANPARAGTDQGRATDCGSHTHTLVPDEDERPGADLRGLLHGERSCRQSEYGNACKRVDENGERHNKISVVEVPLGDPTRDGS